MFNGANVCPTCLHPGVWDSSRYYLPDTKYPTRTNSSVIKAASDAEEDGKVVLSIKGGSDLTGIIIDLVDDVPIDYMHCVLEGVVKWLMEHWYGSSNHGCPYYIGRHIKEIDSRLLQQRPPHENIRVYHKVYKNVNIGRQVNFAIDFYIILHFIPTIICCL